MKFYRPILKLNRLFISIELITSNDKCINSHIIYQMFNTKPNNNIFGAAQNNPPFSQPQNNNVFGNNNTTGQGNVFGNRSTYSMR